MKSRTPWLSLMTVLLAIIACWFPLYFMLIVASRDSAAATRFPPPPLPGGNLLTNVALVLDAVPFTSALFNSVIVSTLSAFGQVTVCALAGYAFARLRFRGRNVLFAALVFTLTVPTQLAMIPSYVLVSGLGWIDNLSAVIVPGLASAFGVMWMRQYVEATVPEDLVAAAMLDGCGAWTTFWHVALPALRPGLIVLASIAFTSTWGDFMWPFLTLRDPGVQTIQVALKTLQNEHWVDYSLAFTGALMATAPMIVILLLSWRTIASALIRRTPR